VEQVADVMRPFTVNGNKCSIHPVASCLVSTGRDSRYEGVREYWRVASPAAVRKVSNLIIRSGRGVMAAGAGVGLPKQAEATAMLWLPKGAGGDGAFRDTQLQWSSGHLEGEKEDAGSRSLIASE
jgi:hypothetical protein